MGTTYTGTAPNRQGGSIINWKIWRPSSPAISQTHAPPTGRRMVTRILRQQERGLEPGYPGVPSVRLRGRTGSAAPPIPGRPSHGGQVGWAIDLDGEEPSLAFGSASRQSIAPVGIERDGGFRGCSRQCLLAPSLGVAGCRRASWFLLALLSRAVSRRGRPCVPGRATRLHRRYEAGSRERARVSTRVKLALASQTSVTNHPPGNAK